MEDTEKEFNELTQNLSDPQHPDYKLWMEGHQDDPRRIALAEKRDQLYQRKFGKADVDALKLGGRSLEDYNAQLDGGIARAKAEHARQQQTEGAGILAANIEPSPVDLEVSQTLQAEWGGEYEAQTAAVGEALREIFPTVEDLVAAGKKLGLDRDPAKQVEICKLLAGMRRRR